MNEKNYNENRIPGFWPILIALLISSCLVVIIFPVYTGGGNYYRPQCLSNIKQLLTANNMYVADFDDLFPPHFSFESTSEQDQFVTALFPYFKNKDLLLCSELEHEVKVNKKPSGVEARIGTIDYVHCLTLRGQIPDYSTGKRLLAYSKIDKPDQVAYLRDTIQGYGPVTDKRTIEYLSPHESKFNIGFLDGHARSLEIVDPSKQL